MEYILKCDKIITSNFDDIMIVEVGDEEIAISKKLMDHMKTYKAGHTELNNWVNQGRTQAQDTYRRLMCIDVVTREEIFGYAFMDCIIRNLTVDEIEQKLNEYDMRQIKRGDGIISKGDNVHGVVLDINYNAGDGPNHATQYLIWFENGVAGWCFSNTFLPDGKHYPMAEGLYEDLVNGK